jgi:hypothetical protein
MVSSTWSRPSRIAADQSADRGFEPYTSFGAWRTYGAFWPSMKITSIGIGHIARCIRPARSRRYLSLWT